MERTANWYKAFIFPPSQTELALRMNERLKKIEWSILEASKNIISSG